MRGLLTFVVALLLTPVSPGTQGTPVYEIYAIRFGVIPQFAVSGLVAGADPARKLDIPVMVWLLKGADGRRVLTRTSRSASQSRRRSMRPAI
jgi:hypothetical protein